MSNDISATIVQKWLASLDTDNDFTKFISLRSLGKQINHYTISSDVTGAIYQCSCPCMTDSNSVCKHTFLAEYHPGYIIN